MTLDCCLTPTPTSNDDDDDGDDMRMVVLCDFDLSKTKAGSMDWVFVCMICNSTGLQSTKQAQREVQNDFVVGFFSPLSLSSNRCRRAVRFYHYQNTICMRYSTAAQHCY
jgi:hypothetical protein